MHITKPKKLAEIEYLQFCYKTYAKMYWQTQKIRKSVEESRKSRDVYVRNKAQRRLEDHFMTVSAYLDNCGYGMSFCRKTS